MNEKFAQITDKLLYWVTEDRLVRFDSTVPVTDRIEDCETMFGPGSRWVSYGTFIDVKDGKRLRIPLTQLQIWEAPVIKDEVNNASKEVQTPKSAIKHFSLTPDQFDMFQKALNESDGKNFTLPKDFFFNLGENGNNEPKE